MSRKKRKPSQRPQTTNEVTEKVNEKAAEKAVEKAEKKATEKETGKAVEKAAPKAAEILSEVESMADKEKQENLSALKQAALEAEPDDGWTTTSVSEPKGDSSGYDETADFSDDNGSSDSSDDWFNKKRTPPPTSGKPISEAEKARQAAAIDMLDHDLELAHRKKVEEEESDRRRIELQKQKEEERLKKARFAMEQREMAEIRAKKAAADKAAEAEKEDPKGSKKKKGGENTYESENGTVSHGTKKAKRRRSARMRYNTELISMSFLRTLIGLVILAAIAYAGIYIYISHKMAAYREEVSNTLTNLGKYVTDESIPYDMPDISELNADQKEVRLLQKGLTDSDFDGLDDAYEMINGTNPAKPDSDSDGILDGMELKAGFDPLNPSTDGISLDSNRIVNTTVSGNGVRVEMKDISRAAQITLVPAQNTSLNGTPGMVSTAYEFYCNSNYSDAQIFFNYDPDKITALGLDPAGLGIFKYNPSKLSFEMVASEYVSGDIKAVCAHLNGNGVYALFDAKIALAAGKTQVFFLFDNSGSMYPEELCANSEENDVDFKRIDMALNLIDMLGDNVYYGAGGFSGTYTNITPISNDIEAVKAKIDNIRNVIPPFTGTQIAEALDATINEFGTINKSDRNYIILLTDGMPTTVNEAFDQQVIEKAQSANITIFTIGLGKNINTEYLNNFAISTNGQFFQASNADALEFLYNKIENFMSYNQVVINEQTGEEGFIIADSGFDVRRDGIGYNNFRAEFAPRGANVGIAGLIRAYFRGELNLHEDAYRLNDGMNINGYDISGISALADGKLNLSDIKVDILDKYTEYLNIKKKWDFKSVTGNVLYLSEETRKFAEDAGLRIITSTYDFDPPQLSPMDEFFATITGTQFRPFTSYENVLIDSNICKGDDEQIMNMIRWYNYLPESSATNVHILDFGYQGDAAFDALVDELSTGSPAVITFGGNALNAVRLTRDNSDPNAYTLEAYDSNSPERATLIKLTKSTLYTWKHSNSQYTASINDEISPLRIIIID